MQHINNENEEQQLELQIRQLKEQQALRQQKRDQQRINSEAILKKASQERNIAKIKECFAAGINTDLTAELKQACKNNDLDLVNLLLDKNQARLEPEFRYACRKGYVELVEKLLKYKLDIDSFNGYSPVPYEDKIEDDEVEDDEVKDDAVPGDAIYNAIKGDHPEILNLLLTHATTIQANKIKKYQHDHRPGEDIFSVVCPTNEILMAQLATIQDIHSYILPHMSDTKMRWVAGRHQSLLIEAINANSEKCVNFLINKFNSTPQFSRVIHYSWEVSAPDSEYCNRYRDLDVNTMIIQKSDPRNEPITWTVYWKDHNTTHQRSINASEILDLDNALAKYSSDHAYYTACDETTLIDKIVSKFGVIRANRLYQLFYPAESNNYMGTLKGSALCHAIDTERFHLAKLLLDKNVDIECKYGNEKRYESSLYGGGGHYAWDGQRDETALVLAAKKGNRELVELLVRAGADILVKNRNGKTAADLTNDAEIKKLLLGVKSYSARLGRLPSAPPTPAWLCCPISGKIFEDPICAEGVIVDRVPYVNKNNTLPSGQKLSPNGDVISDVEYQKIATSKTVKAMALARDAYVCEQEENARSHRDPNPAVKMKLF